MAEAVGRDYSGLARYLTSNRGNARRLPLNLLPAIARALDTTAHELIREAEESL